MIEVNEALKTTYIETAKALKGSARRMFMARIVQALGRGGQTWAERELGWCRDTIRKGAQELETGPQADNFAARGRKPLAERLPHLRNDIRDLLDGQSQTDPTFASQRLYTRLSAREVREQLIARKGYTDAELPGPETIRVQINDLGWGNEYLGAALHSAFAHPIVSLPADLPPPPTRSARPRNRRPKRFSPFSWLRERPVMRDFARLY